MTQVGGQQGQLSLDIGAGPVPAQQSIDGEAVPKIVDPRQLSFRRADAAFLQQGLQAVVQARAGVGAAAPRRIPDEWRVCGGSGGVSAGSGAQIALDLIGDLRVDRKQTGLIELRLPNVQSRFPPVVVTERQIQQFAAPDSRGEQQDDRKASQFRAERRGAASVSSPQPR